MQLSNYFKILKCYIIRLKGFKNSRIYKLVLMEKNQKVTKLKLTQGSSAIVLLYIKFRFMEQQKWTVSRMCKGRMVGRDNMVT